MGNTEGWICGVHPGIDDENRKTSAAEHFLFDSENEAIDWEEAISQHCCIYSKDVWYASKKGENKSKSVCSGYLGIKSWTGWTERFVSLQSDQNLVWFDPARALPLG
eukprot:307710_1